jgi:pimeloyl-ACP methyl ester carboxylesterase
VLSALGLVLAVGGCSRAAAPADADRSTTSASATTASPDAAPATPGDLTSATPGGATPSANSSTTVAAAGPTPPYTDVVLAGGVRQYLHCRGTGSPTVVVVTDLSVPATDWLDATAGAETTTRVCLYDRPGVGLSPPRTSPNQVTDAGLNARELAALLATARQAGPYLLVGQGYGTLVARTFAREHPTLVRGLLLGGDAPAAAGPFWTEAGHRVAVATSTAAAGAEPQTSASDTVVTGADGDAAALGAQLPDLLGRLGG